MSKPVIDTQRPTQKLEIENTCGIFLPCWLGLLASLSKKHHAEL